MNEEQTASQKTALLHRTRDALAMRTLMRTARLGLHSNPVDIDESSPMVGSPFAFRSSGAPTAGHQARSGGTRYIFASPGQIGRAHV